MATEKLNCRRSGAAVFGREENYLSLVQRATPDTVSAERLGASPD